MRRIFILALIAGLIAASPIGSAATTVNRRHPPRAALIHKREVVQRARPYTYCWGYTTAGGGGHGTCADGAPGYPKPASVDAGARLAIRIRYPAKPRDWFLQAHRAVVDRDGWHETVGPAERIPFRLKPHRVDGVVRAWDLVFRLEEPLRHYYIDTGGELKQGDAYYALHVQT